jgi:prefoldin subunit 5
MFLFILIIISICGSERDEVIEILEKIMFRLDKIEKKIEKMEEKIEKMEEKIEKMEEKIEKMEEKIEKMEEKFDKKFKKMEEKIEKMEEKFKKMEDNFYKELYYQFDVITKKFSGEHSFMLARESTVSITFSPPSSLNNTNACGSVVEINGNLYIATAAHVIFNNESNCTRSIERIADVYGHNISFSTYGLIHNNPNIDIALIPITGTKVIENVKPLKVPKENIEMPSIIISTSIRNGALVYLYCHVLEIHAERLITNCGGTHGHSGSGYLTLNGEFIGIHKGQGPIAHLEGDEESLGKKMLEDFGSECWNPNKYFSDECQKKFINISSFHSRNPRCTVVPSSFLRSLSDGLNVNKMELGSCKEKKVCNEKEVCNE